MAFTVGDYLVLSNIKIAPKIYEMVLDGDTSAISNSGQFINIQIQGKYLRRPISICDYNDRTITIIYKVVGEGTEILASLDKGAMLNCMVGLGNGFDTNIDKNNIVLIGGGVGLPPLYRLAKDLKKLGKKVSLIMGFNTSSELYYLDKFTAVCDSVNIATVDGSMGKKGFVTAYDINSYDYYYACGPEGMLQALLKLDVEGQLSYESRMGCGFGVCMGCSCKTLLGYKRICKDGPVMQSWEMKGVTDEH